MAALNRCTCLPGLQEARNMYAYSMQLVEKYRKDK
jgi:hypothetical protein